MNRVSSVSSSLQDRMSRVVAAATDFETTPAGTRKRTPDELEFLWDSVMALDEPERNEILKTISKKAGHKDDEPKPCEMCRFVAGRLVN